MKGRPRIYYSASQRALIWERWRKGETLHQIARFHVAASVSKGIKLFGVTEFKSGLIAHPSAQAAFKRAMIARTEGAKRQAVGRTGTVRRVPHHERNRLVVEDCNDGGV